MTESWEFQLDLSVPCVTFISSLSVDNGISHDCHSFLGPLCYVLSFSPRCTGVWSWGLRTEFQKEIMVQSRTAAISFSF